MSSGGGGQASGLAGMSWCPGASYTLEDLGWRVLALRGEYVGTRSSSAGPTGPTTSLRALPTAPLTVLLRGIGKPWVKCGSGA